jgi:hypothetical protein
MGHNLLSGEFGLFLKEYLFDGNINFLYFLDFTNHCKKLGILNQHLGKK